MVFDARDNYTLLFGGHTATQVYNDTWAFEAGGWVKLSPKGAPPARYGASIAYDPSAKAVVLFGGRGASGLLNDTWSYAGGRWTQHFPTRSPGVRQFAAFAFDAKDRYDLLFGGSNGVLLGDTWSYSGGKWTIVPTARSPPFRSGASMAYDSTRGAIVLFGGSGPSTAFNDTWEYSGGRWSWILHRSPPAPRTDASMVYLASSGTLLLYGGLVRYSAGLLSYGFEETWQFARGNWSQTNYEPAARIFAGMTYDAKDGYVLLFGGNIAFTSIRGTQVGTEVNITWKFSHGIWTQVHTPTAPSGRMWFGLTYDAADGYVVLYGGSSWYSGLPSGGWGVEANDTWTYSGGVWTNVTTTQNPGPRCSFAMSYDAADAQVILFGGGYCYDLGYAELSDTWAFSAGSWHQVNTTGAPSARVGSAMSYDPIDQYLLLFGGWNGKGYLNDTWSYRGGVWSNVTSAVGPSQRVDSVMDYAPWFGEVVLFGGANSTHRLGDVWAFTGGNWAQLSPRGSPAPLSASAMAYDPKDRSLVLLGGWLQSNEYSNETWTFR
jgi:galactose oxidase-like protein